MSTTLTTPYTKEWLLKHLAQDGPTEPNVTSTLINYDELQFEDLFEDCSDYVPNYTDEGTDA